jgi:hypothetical protein
VEVTGETDPLAAARAVLARPGAKTRWCVVKEGGAGALLAERRPGGGVEAHQCPAMQVRGAGRLCTRLPAHLLCMCVCVRVCVRVC